MRDGTTRSVRNRLKIKPISMWGIVTVFHETTRETDAPVLEKIAEIAPAGRVWGGELKDVLARYTSFSGHSGKASLTVANKRVDIGASLVPCMLFGFIELPEWLVASIEVEVYIDESLALRHTFW